jgi:hypothetical protein
MIEVINTIVSMPFAIAITAILRKRYPVIDGAYVYLVVACLSIIGSLLTRYSYAIPDDVWLVASPLLTAILAIGGVSVAQHVATPSPVFDPHEAPTRKEVP